MSGVAALLGRDARPIADDVLRSMALRLAHCGPDHSAVWTAGHVGLAHRALRTTPEDHFATQPLARDGFVIAADARLDNRDELLDLRARDRLPPERVSDAELILWAYRRWGEGCAARLLGDFAFVIWDGTQLVCTRDHLGIRPLFYTADARTFRCASEMDALFADPSLRRRPNRMSIGQYLVEEFAEVRESLYEDVFVLPPGHTLVVTADSLRVAPYWQPNPWRTIRHRNDDEYAEHFRDVFQEAVRARLRSPGAVAAQVSGGMDSSSIASVSAHLARSGRAHAAPKLIRMAFPGLDCDETPFSQAVADRWRLPIHSVVPPPDPGLYEPHVRQMQPDVYFHPMSVPWRRMCEFARDSGSSVLMTGLGSDQVLCRTGYESYDALRRGNLLGAVKMAGVDKRPLARASWRRLIRDSMRPMRTAARRALGRDRAPSWLTRDVARDVEAAAMRGRRAHTLDRYPGWTERTLWQSIIEGGELPLSIAQLGRFAARSSVEVRHPFLDLRVVELLLAFPPEQRLGLPTKPVLRRAMRGILPELVRTRPSGAEFSSYARWSLWDPHRQRVRRLLAGGELEGRGIVDAAGVSALLAEPSSTEQPPLRDFINLTALELWLRHIQS